MSRKYRYSKNNLTNINPPRNPAPGTRPARPIGNEHDIRYESRQTRGPRGRGPRGRGNNQRHDLRNNLRNNHVLSNVSREEETFKVTIPLSDKYDQLYLMGLVRENLSDPNVVFYNFQRVQNSHVFYVVGSDNAETLRDLSRRITTNSGQRLVILTTKAPLPCANLDERVEAVIKVTMSRLYDLNTNVMDLSDFRQAEEFKQQGLFVTIGKANVLRTIVSIIIENTPNLVALNLRDNKLNFLEPLKLLSKKCLSLRALDLSRNRIHLFNEVMLLQGLDLIELNLEGNPFIDDFASHATYIRSCRKLFKNLRKLDNEDLPDEIGFDLAVPENLPEMKDNYIPPETSQFVYQFLEAYYKMYDSDSRQGLIQAYHDYATFSFSYSKHDNTTAFKVNDQMAGYRDSHNLIRLRDESLWVKFVKTSNVDIVSFLCKFPNTEHDPSSFKIDIPFCEGNMVIIVVNGTFKETFKANKPLRSFCRTFFVVPQGQGFVIVNEMLVISNPSARQSISNSKQNNETSTSRAKLNNHHHNNNNIQQDRLMSDVEFTNNPSTSSALNSFGGPVDVSGVVPIPITAAPMSSLMISQEEIILKFMQVTNMNRSFSLKCLEENGFNPDAAFEVFQKLQSNNMIPAEAFVK